MLIASTLSSSNNADFGPASKFVRIVDQMWTRVARFCSSNGEVVGEMWAAVGDLWGPPDLTMGWGRGGRLVWGHGSPNGSPNVGRFARESGVVARRYEFRRRSHVRKLIKANFEIDET